MLTDKIIPFVWPMWARMYDSGPPPKNSEFDHLEAMMIGGVPILAIIAVALLLTAWIAQHRRRRDLSANN